MFGTDAHAHSAETEQEQPQQQYTQDASNIMVKDDFLTLKQDTQVNNPKDPKEDVTTQCDADYSASSPEEEETSSSQRHLQEQLQEALRDGQWNRVESLCEDHPSLAREPISMVCQGENSTCLPIHFAAGQKSTPVSTIDALVTAHPSSLLATESSGLRLALHISVLKGASFALIRYLCEAFPQSMGVKDQEGNLPLHYAAMYSNDEIVQLLVKKYPEGCRQVNRSDRLPLHLLCARCWEHEAIAVQTIQGALDQYPEALKTADRRGRLPLHVLCSSHPRADVLQILVASYPEALLETDKSKSTPLDLARTFEKGGGVVVALLEEGTKRERRKKYKFLAPFKNVGGKIARRRHAKADVDALHLHYCYG